MKTFIIDWGSNAQGGRYGLIQANSEDDAWDIADSIGGPFHIADFKIPRWSDGIDSMRYIEFNSPDEAFAGPKMDVFKWKHSSETGFMASLLKQP